jgi:F-type H+-transporting ATPase subunit delta
MSLRTSAARYAKALLEVAILESDPSRVEADLTGIVDAMKATPELRRGMLSPGIAQSARVSLVKAIIERASLQAPVAKLLMMLAERGRLELLPDLLEVYRERLLAHSNVVRGQITSAAPLPPDRLQALQQSLSVRTAKQVQLDTAVDPSLIGGVVARIGSTVYDGSVRTQLQKMRQQMIGNK